MKYVSAVIIAIAFISCSKDDTEIINPPLDTSVPISLPDVSYGANAAQKMDVYLPAGRSTANTPVIIMIHGGGWTTGDKVDFNPFVDTLKRRLPSYAIININYRLSANPLNVFPTQELDVKAATEYVYSKLSEYSISNKFVLAGASAGGHLAMLQAYKYNSPVKAKAVISFFGPSDLTDMYNNPVGGNPLLSFGLAQAVGKTPAQDPVLYTSSSPVTYISSSTAMPTILLHGGLDPLVSPTQSEAVKNKLNTAGIANQYWFYPTGGHGDWNSTLYYDAFNKITAFLGTHVL